MEPRDDDGRHDRRLSENARNLNQLKAYHAYGRHRLSENGYKLNRRNVSGLSSMHRRSVWTYSVVGGFMRRRERVVAFSAAAIGTAAY